MERHRRQLDVKEWQAIEAAEGFWRLSDAGYVSYRRAGTDRFEIVGHKYVGRARVGGIEIQVREKVPGTLLSLIGAATGAELRIEKAESPATEFDVVSRHLLTEFTRAAGRYVSDRRVARYRYRRASGSVLAGRLDMPATMRLHAAGRLGIFAYREGAVVRDEPLDRLVLAGLDELDRAARVLRLDPSTVYDARWLAGALSEVRDQAFVTSSAATFLSLGDDIERDSSMLSDDVDLARLAAVALLHRGFEPNLPGHSDVPRAWFLDLETLFEQAVRETLRELLKSHEVDRGESYGRRMFTGGSDASRTNPDIVVHREGVVRAAGDVKYKSLTAALGELSDNEKAATQRPKKEGRPDLYQMLVHAASLDTDRAFLVYAGDGAYSSRYLGRSATGCRTWTAQVRPTHLTEDLARFIEECELIRQ
ncbi:MAG: hypothetical protein HZB14_00520 [Actinobacteria bacterium]|nr:hypothetical protein [Actinomycetota bacterium]